MLKNKPLNQKLYNYQLAIKHKQELQRKLERKEAKKWILKSLHQNHQQIKQKKLTKMQNQMIKKMEIEGEDKEKEKKVEPAFKVYNNPSRVLPK